MPSEKITRSEEYVEKQNHPTTLICCNIDQHTFIFYFIFRDEKFMERLRSIGMTLEDEDKLIHMREYIFKVSGAKMRQVLCWPFNCELT
jgi:hypothetical protein